MIQRLGVFLAVSISVKIMIDFLLAFSVTYFVYERYILKASGSGLTSLIIADNNLGLVSIYGDRYKILSHKLLVRTIKETKTKIHETITELGFW